jgi:hypothetical protein
MRALPHTFPARSKAEVLHPGGQAAEHLVLQLCDAASLQLPCHQLHAQQLAQLWMVPAWHSQSVIG